MVRRLGRKSVGLAMGPTSHSNFFCYAYIGDRIVDEMKSPEKALGQGEKKRLLAGSSCSLPLINLIVLDTGYIAVASRRLASPVLAPNLDAFHMHTNIATFNRPLPFDALLEFLR